MEAVRHKAHADAASALRRLLSQEVQEQLAVSSSCSVRS
jgi:hypothetical protein